MFLKHIPLLFTVCFFVKNIGYFWKRAKKEKIQKIFFHSKILFLIFLLSVNYKIVFFLFQNHMFSELLFLRFNGVLEQRAGCLTDHLSSFHQPGERHCCVVRADNLHSMFAAINKVNIKYTHLFFSKITLVPPTF